MRWCGGEEGELRAFVFAGAVPQATKMGEPYVTIVGFGSLLSKRSAQTTTPSLRNYQYVRVKGFQRIFQHPAAIFFERGPWPGIALPATKEVASLSTRPDPDSSFVACAYQIPKSEWEPLAEREEEFSFVDAEFEPLGEEAVPYEGGNVGVMCTQSTDSKLQETSLWERYITHLEPNYGETKVWSWGPDSGILPCRVYTRHCVLAVSKEFVPPYVTDRPLALMKRRKIQPPIIHPPTTILGADPQHPATLPP